MILENILTLKQTVRDCCVSCGRSPDSVMIVAVSKTVDPGRMHEAYSHGMRIFGENRVQEFVAKKDMLPPDCSWHLIGSLQTNKVKYVVGNVALIHAVDRIALAHEIERCSAKKHMVTPVLVQVNTSHEDTKSGVRDEEVPGLLAEMSHLSHVRVRGFMTIGPLTDDQDHIRACFRQLRMIRDRMQHEYPEVDMSELSMGMTHDYSIAIQEGATIIRVGSGIFGARTIKG